MVLALSGLALLAAATAMAQPTEEQRAQWRAMREARGESAGPRPPEGASQEEKRAFYQKRAAERAQAEAAAVTPAAAAPAASVQSHAAHTAPTPPARKPESGGKPGPGAVPPAPTPAAASGGSRGGGSMGGMPSGTRGGGAIWLSDMPPMRGDAVRPEGSRGGGMGNMSGMEMGGERSGPRVKRLWLRSGADPQKSPFYREEADAAPEMLLVTPQGKPEGEPLPPAEEGKKNLAFPMPAQGFYRVYVTTRKLAGDILNVSVAKAEVANFTHDADEEERTRASGGNRILETAPIEIVREKARNEPTFFQLRSGNEQAFVVLQKGVPLQGARVRFVSHEGWSKDAVSDEQGRVSYQIIRDYFPPWDDFKKRFKATYLVVAEASAAEPGRHKDQPYATVRYQATLAGSYYPSPNDYRSYAWGLGVGLLITLFCGVAVYLYRRRRIKPFQETRLDDVK
jgi:hypothetical protein